MKLWCLHAGAGTHVTPFCVGMGDPEDTIGDLQTIIKHVQHPTFAHLTPDNLVLFSAQELDAGWLACDTPCHEVDELVRAQRRPTTLLREAFPDAPDDLLYVLVAEYRDDIAWVHRMSPVLPLKRKERCDALNRQLNDVMRPIRLYGHFQDVAAIAAGRVPYAMVTWDAVKDTLRQLLHPKGFLLPGQDKPPPTTTLDLLETIFTMKRASYGLMEFPSDDGAMQLLGIEPIVVAAANVSDPSFRIDATEPLNENYLHVKGEIDLLLTRRSVFGRKKRVGVVAAKDNGMTTAKAQALVAMEPVAECDGVEIVYGIVSNAIDWMFLKRTDAAVYVEMDSVRFEKGVRPEVGRIAAKVYAVLTARA